MKKREAMWMKTWVLPLLAFVVSGILFITVRVEGSKLYFVLSPELFLVFHNLAEFLSVAVSLSIFGIGWFTYEQSKNRHALFLAMASLGIALLDLIHTLSYPGMPDFITLNTTNKSSQLWVAARIFSAVIFLASAFVSVGTYRRWLNRHALILLSLLSVVGVFLLIIVYPGYFPTCYIPGVGLTPFKIYSEYVIIGLLLLAVVAYLWRYKKKREKYTIYFVAALVVSAFSELAFTLYSNPYDTYNLLGHTYKVVAYVLVYWALFKSSVEDPYKHLGEAVRALETSEERFSKAFYSSPNAVTIRRIADGSLLEINQGFCDIFGYTREEALSMTIDQMNLWVDPEGNKKMLKELDEGKEIKGREYLFRRKDGRVIIGKFTAQHINIGGEKCLFVTMEDVTEERTIEKAKSEFVDVASHQMRTPLSAINWYIELLLQRWTELEKKEMRPFIEEIMKAGKRMTDYVNVLLNVAKLEVGNFAVESKPVDIEKVVKLSLEILKPEIERKKLDIAEDYDFRGKFSGDAKLLGIVMDNLLANAVIYTREGGQIIVKVTNEEDRLAISVIDSGVGIPEEDQNRIFQKLFRGRNAKSIYPGGTGLGLYAVKRIVTQSGGEVRFESKEGRGASFFVNYPISGMVERKGEILL